MMQNSIFALDKQQNWKIYGRHKSLKGNWRINTSQLANGERPLSLSLYRAGEWGWYIYSFQWEVAALENSSGGEDWFKNNSLPHHRSREPVSRDILSQREKHRKPDKKCHISLSRSAWIKNFRRCTFISPASSEQTPLKIALFVYERHIV